MDERYIETHDVVARYVKKELTDEELEAFEEYYFEHPDMLETIEAERLLRAGLRAQDDGAHGAAPRKFRPALAMAATLVAGLALGLLLPRPFGEDGPAVGPVQTAWVIANRSASAARIEVADFEQPLVLIVELATALDRVPEAVLVTSDEKVLWRASDVVLDDSGDVSLLLPADIVEARQYELRLLVDGNVVEKREFELTTTRNENE